VKYVVESILKGIYNLVEETKTNKYAEQEVSP
jgi:hypothetical protein